VLAQPAEQAAVIAAFQAARDAEYPELLERLPELEPELAHERARGRTTYAEVEESEATWNGSAPGWPRSPPGTTSAPSAAPRPAAVERCAQALAEFEAAALATEAPDPSPAPTPHHAPPTGPLRLTTPDD
jgi:hypothetical protein